MTLLLLCHTVACSSSCECLGLYSWTCPVLREMISENLTSALSSGNWCFESCFCFVWSTHIHTENDAYFINTPKSIISCLKRLPNWLWLSPFHIENYWFAQCLKLLLWVQEGKYGAGKERCLPLTTVTWGGFLGPKTVEGNDQLFNVVLWRPQIQKYTVNKWIHK